MAHWKPDEYSQDQIKEGGTARGERVDGGVLSGEPVEPNKNTQRCYRWRAKYPEKYREQQRKAAARRRLNEKI